MHTTKNYIYHLIAILTVGIWGLTFISTKVLIEHGLSPQEIFLLRFLMAYLGIWFISPRKLFADNWKDELWLLWGGVTGGSFYFFTENTALEITLATNVAFIVCTAPLLTTILSLLIYKKEKAYVGPFLVLLALFNPPYIARSFQLSSVFYAMILTCIMVLCWDDKEKREHLFLYAFVIDGIILAFLDFLTYPPVAFVVPLCFVLVFSEQDLLHNLLASIRYGIAFLLGYAGMWVSKWILASLFTDENVIAEGIESVLHRTGKGAMSDVDSAFNVEISPAAAMRENLHAFGTRPVRIMVFLLLCAAVVLVIYMIRHKAGFTKRAAGMFVIFALLTIIPIVWIVALNNHCSLHPHLEWREWLVAVFAPLMWLAWFWTDRRKKAVECR